MLPRGFKIYQLINQSQYFASKPITNSRNSHVGLDD